MLIGQDVRMYLNPSITNVSPTDKRFIEIGEVNTFPVLKNAAQTASVETYDSEWTEKLVQSFTTSDINIGLNKTLESDYEELLLESFNEDEEIQLKIEFYDATSELTYYFLLNGVITGVSNGGGIDAVSTVNYTFSTEQLFAQGSYEEPDVLYVGDGGVLANDDDIINPVSVAQQGNSFIKIATDDTTNTLGTELLGIVNVSGTSHTSIQTTKSGSLRTFIENGDNRAEVYTTLKKPSAADVGAYTTEQTDTAISGVEAHTINGYALSTDPVLNAGDVGTYDAGTIDNKIATVNAVVSAITPEYLDVYTTEQTDTAISGVEAHTINGYALSTNPVLVAGDVGTYDAATIDGMFGGIDSGVISVNGKTGDVTLTATDITGSVLTVNDVAPDATGNINVVVDTSGYLPLTGGEITGDITVDGSLTIDGISIVQFLATLGPLELHNYTASTSRAGDDALIQCYDYAGFLSYAFGYYADSFYILAYNDDASSSTPVLDLTRDGDLHVTGTITPTDYSNFDERYQSINTNVLEQIYAVGNYYESETDSRNPADILGFGTWESRTGLLYGAGTIVDKDKTDEAGNALSYTITAGAVAGRLYVTEGNIESISPTATFTGDPVPDHTHGYDTKQKTAVQDGDATPCWFGDATGQTDPAGGHTPTGSVSVSAVGTQSEVLMLPGYACYRWVRTA